MGRFISLRRDRRDRQSAIYALGQANAVRVVSVYADVSDGNAVITFNKTVQNLPAWSAGMMTFDQSGTPRVDSAWSLTSPTSITVVIAGLAAGRILVTFGSEASAIGFVGGGTVNGQTAGGGSIA